MSGDWTWQSGSGDSVKIGYGNSNGQRCCGHRGVAGTDHMQYAYKVECTNCGYVYGANGSDMHARRCPECQGGAPGIPYWKVSDTTNTNAANQLSTSERPTISDKTTRPHPLEKFLLDTYRLDGAQLHRIGMFLLGHLLIDKSLVALDAYFEGRGRGIDIIGAVVEDEALFERAARRRFADRLVDARDRGLLSEADALIAKTVNTARNTFLHYARRWQLPEYHGVSVSEERGLRSYLDDVMDYLDRQGPLMALTT